MAYSLANLISLAHPQGRRRYYAVPAVTLPLYQERALLVIMMRVLRAWEDAYRRLVLPQYTLPVVDGLTRDDLPGLEAGMREAEGEISRLLLELSPVMHEWVVRAERLHASQLAKGVKVATGVDLTTTVGLAAEQQTMAAVLARITNLVTGLSDDTRKTLSEIIWRGFTSRTPRDQVAREIREALQIRRTRARFIARDQTTKLAATLDEVRQVEMGIDRYRWRHSRKARPRKEHVARDGKLFFWKKPPHDGHPGHAPNCGCKAEGYVDLEA